MMVLKKTRLCHAPFPFLTYSSLITISSIIVSISDAFSPANLTTLNLVQIISRHGDRAPILPFPNDLYRNASVYSINGWGELSEIGAKQVFELGTFLRQRYDGFLPRKYRKRDFLMISSDIDRAIMSAESNLAGLYSLGPIIRSRDIFKEWQPVPIHTVPESEDNFINGKAHCSRYVSLYKQFLDSEEFRSFLMENELFIDFVVDMSGLSAPAIAKDFSLIFQVQDALRCQRLHNLTLPTWTNTTVIERLDYFKALSFVWAVKTFEMKRLKVGPLFGRLVESMSAKVEAATNNLIINNNGKDENEEEEIPPYKDPVAYRKMYVYSSHDSTISGLLDALNLFNPPFIPSYASALIIELHRGPEDGKFYVELFYRNDTGEPFHFDPNLFCGESPCSFESFYNIAKNFIPSDWGNECQLQSQSLSSSSSSSSSSTTTQTQASSLSRGAPKNPPPLMREVPVDVLTLHSNINGLNQSLSEMSLAHPLGMTAPGLSGFLLTVLSMMSLLASLVLLKLLMTNRNESGRFPLYSAAYQHLRQ